MTIFERCALALLGSLILALVAMAVWVPLDIRTAAPQATYLYAAALPEAPEIDSVPAVIPEAEPARPKVTAESVADAFADMGYDLDSVLEGDDLVPRVILTRIPAGLEDMAEVKDRKALFFQTVLPLVLKVNEEIAQERKRLWQIRTARAMGRKLSAIDRLWIAVACDKYKVARGDLDSLIDRIDIVPPSIALAQAAEESGWGTSRFVREGNAIFGQWTTARGRGLKPKDRDEGETHRVRAFDSLLDSVRAYALNLNTHRAYRDFRRLRADLRTEGQPVAGDQLLPALTPYSERGKDYVRTLRQIITINDLARADETRLRDRDDSGLRMAGEAAPQTIATVDSDETI